MKKKSQEKTVNWYTRASGHSKVVWIWDWDAGARRRIAGLRPSSLAATGTLAATWSQRDSSKYIIGRSKGEIDECYHSVMLDCPDKCTAVLGQEWEIVGTPITHIKAEVAKFGLGLVFHRVREAHHWKMWHASGSMLLILETPYYTFVTWYLS